MADSDKKYTAQEVVAEVVKTLKKCIEDTKGVEKTFTAREAVAELAKSLKTVLEGAKPETITPAADETLEKNSEEPTKPTELNRTITGCESTHYDAIDHHSFIAAARFHEDEFELAQKHLELCKAHADAVGFNAKNIIDIAYEITEDMPAISTTFGKEFIPHPMDDQLAKAAPSVESVRIKDGVGVDMAHTGKTPKDEKPKLVNDPQKEAVKKAAKKMEEESSDDEEGEEESSEELEKAKAPVPEDVKNIRRMKGHPPTAKAEKKDESTDESSEESSVKKGSIESSCNSVMNKKGDK